MIDTAQVVYDLIDYMATPYEGWASRAQWPKVAKREVVPMLSLSEDKESVYAKLIIPGVKRENVKVNLEDGVLHISGLKEKPEIQGKAMHRGRWYGEFARSVEVSSEIDLAKVEAHYDNGILTVVMPKTAKAKTIAVAIN